MLTPTAARLGWTPGGDVTADAAADPSTPRGPCPCPSLQRAQLTSRCTGAAAHSGGQKWGGAAPTANFSLTPHLSTLGHRPSSPTHRIPPHLFPPHRPHQETTPSASRPPTPLLRTSLHLDTAPSPPPHRGPPSLRRGHPHFPPPQPHSEPHPAASSGPVTRWGLPAVTAAWTLARASRASRAATPTPRPEARQKESECDSNAQGAAFPNPWSERASPSLPGSPSSGVPRMLANANGGRVEGHRGPRALSQVIPVTRG